MEEQRIYMEEPDGSLLLAYIRESASAKERIVVENWLCDKESNEDLLLQIARIYYAQYTHKRIVERDSFKAFDKVHGKIKQHIWRRNFYRISLVASCIAVGFFLSFILSWRNVVDNGTNVQMITVRANPGMRTSCNLPDGTVAYLNSGSILTYPIPYNKNKREVALEGEAYFKVTHDPAKPFIVSVADDRLKVKVLGTEFNLHACREEGLIETTLVTGKVDIEVEKEDGTVLRRELSPSEKATYVLSSGKMDMKRVNTLYETAWIEGRLIFNDSSLPEVLRDLSYFYNVKFEVKDPLIKTYSFTGTFVDKQLSQILDYLKISSGIDYRIKQVSGDDSKGIKHTVVELTNEREK